MDRPGVRQVPEGSGEQGKIEKTGCKIICGAPTTLAVKGLMMMMMMTVDELSSVGREINQHKVAMLFNHSILFIHLCFSPQHRVTQLLPL